jgi:DNA invertase Pin-like site-specific DNA recombinase
MDGGASSGRARQVDARGSVSAHTKLFAAFAQFELEIMKERQREGIADAKAAGRCKGRKPISRCSGNRDFSAPRNQSAALWMQPEGGISAV